MKYITMIIFIASLISCDNYYKHLVLKEELSMKKKSVVWSNPEASIVVGAELFKDNTHGLKKSHVKFTVICRVQDDNMFHFMSDAVSVKMNESTLHVDTNTLGTKQILGKQKFVIYGLIPKSEIEKLDNNNFELQLPNINQNERNFKIDPVVFKI